MAPIVAADDDDLETQLGQTGDIIDLARAAWCTRAMRYLSLLLCAFLSVSVAAEELRLEAETSRFNATLEPRLTPLEINRMHAWEIHLSWHDGRPVEGAEIEIGGGMPLHDHGLPSRPRVTQYLGDGVYLVEGMRFHMPGEWILDIDITWDGAKERIKLPLELH